MRELAILSFITLDGVMQSPTSPDEDPSNGFTQGGWAAEYWEEVMAQVMVEAMAEPYDLLFGRKTYDSFAKNWTAADAENPVAQKLNSANKYVATTATTTNIEWQNTVRLNGDIPAEVKRLKAQEGPLLQVHGSCDLIQTLLLHDLVDEFRLWTFPVVLGSGKCLFRHGAIPRELILVKSAATSNGVVMGIYRRRQSAAH